MRAQNRANGDDSLQAQARGGRSRGYPQREITAEREPDQVERLVRPGTLDGADPVDDLVDAAGMEQALIQRLRPAVIAKVQPQDVIAGVLQILADRDHVVGVGATFPAMQHDYEAPAFMRCCIE